MRTSEDGKVEIWGDREITVLDRASGCWTFVDFALSCDNVVNKGKKHTKYSRLARKVNRLCQMKTKVAPLAVWARLVMWLSWAFQIWWEGCIPGLVQP